VGKKENPARGRREIELTHPMETNYDEKTRGGACDREGGFGGKKTWDNLDDKDIRPSQAVDERGGKRPEEGDLLQKGGGKKGT